ncbi:MAG TPA: tRNA uridine-5-carboxymethylaminomethyl(34) synthesis GTPase MnmE [Pseudomonadales bacterium]
MARPEPTTLDTDTIAAVATAPGVGGIGVVRVSGPRALEIGRAVTGRRLPPRRAVRAAFHDAAGEAVDSGLALAFTAPASFTGEDVVELHGHGGPVVLQLVLDAVLARGARLARPGEFTERAFLNGKLDLAQAEAVADLIASASGAAARGAMRSLEGEFSRAVEALDRELLELRVHVEAAMDFPEEGEDFLAEGRVPERLAALEAGFAELLGRTRQGVLLRDGVAVALVGAPNVGKSSLLNRLAGQERAIVTEIPGTTRDLLHADLSLDGLPVQIVDTAGLRESADPVEREGVRRAREQASRADLVLVLEDDRDGPAETDPVLRELLGAGLEPGRLIRVRNKVDLSGAPAGRSPDLDGIAVVRISALTGAGVDALVSLVKQKTGFAGEGTTFTARRRHIDALERGAAALRRARELAAQGAPAELAAEELRAVHLELGRIVGTVSADELLGEIFASFCIGK